MQRTLSNPAARLCEHGSRLAMMALLALLIGTVIAPATRAAGQQRQSTSPIRVAIGFHHNSSRLSASNKHKLAQAIAVSNSSGSLIATRSLRIVARADSTCGVTSRATITRGDISTCQWRALARSRARSIRRYVRSRGYQGTIDSAISGVAGGPSSNTASATFRFGGPAQTLAFTVVNDSDGAPEFGIGSRTVTPVNWATSVSVSYSCVAGTCTGFAPVPTLTATSFSGTTVMPTVSGATNVSLTVPTVSIGSGNYSQYTLIVSGGTCSPAGGGGSAIAATFSCSLTTAGATVTIEPGGAV